MNATQEQLMTVAEFEQLVARAVETAKTASPETVFGELEKLGLKYSTGSMPHWGGEDVKWEHPDISAHNKRCGSKGILAQGFYTIYAYVRHYPEAKYGNYTMDAHTEGCIEFIRGRVGNTYAVQFRSKLAA
jgi:hypothetical protein